VLPVVWHQNPDSGKVKNSISSAVDARPSTALRVAPEPVDDGFVTQLERVDNCV
jgi:hypothetical protein